MNTRITLVLAMLSVVIGTSGCSKGAGTSSPSIDPTTSAELAKLGAPIYPNAKTEGEASIADTTENGKHKVSVDLVTTDDPQTVNAWYKTHVGPKYVYTDQSPMSVYQTENLLHVPYGKVVISPQTVDGKNGTEVLLWTRED